MNHVLCFGEILVRQQALHPQFLAADKNTFAFYPGGSEANVAASLAQMGIPSYYATAWPDNAWTQALQAHMSALGVDTSKSICCGDRIGTYTLLGANGLSNGQVVYDRKYSSFSQLRAQDLPMDQLLDGISWLHWTALSPALNAEMAALMKTLLTAAAERDIIISVDLNYRNKLWQYGLQPIEVMPDLVQYCDVIMGNIWAANLMLGTPIADGLDRQSPSSLYVEQANTMAAALFEAFPKAKHIANTFRFMDHPQHNLFYGTYHNRYSNTHTAPLETLHVVDRIGSGDAFMAGLIYALQQHLSPQEIINTATAAGYHKLFVKGDFGNGKHHD